MKRSTQLSISLIAICPIGVILIITGIFIISNPMGVAILFFIYLRIFISNELMEIILLIGTISLIIGIVVLSLSLAIGIPRIIKILAEER